MHLLFYINSLVSQSLLKPQAWGPGIGHRVACTFSSKKRHKEPDLECNNLLPVWPSPAAQHAGECGHALGLMGVPVLLETSPSLFSECSLSSFLLWHLSSSFNFITFTSFQCLLLCLQGDGKSHHWWPQFLIPGRKHSLASEASAPFPLSLGRTVGHHKGQPVLPPVTIWVSLTSTKWLGSCFYTSK